MQKNKKRKVILSILTITLMLASILGTYAYFMASINNDRRQEAEIDTGTMRLRFADGDDGINATLLPKETIIKKFTLENTGTLDVTVSIEWLDMINTYTEGSLTYTLKYAESQDGEYTEIVSKTNVPTSSTEFTSTLVPDITIPVGKTYYYNLEITFNDLEGIDQTSDYDAKFATRFIVSQPSTNRKYTLTIDPNGGTIDGSSEVQTYNLNAGEIQTIINPSNTGCNSFSGWKVSGITEEINDTSIKMGKSNVKLVAQYEGFKVQEALTAILKGQKPKGINETTPTFANAATTCEGVFAMEDDYGTSYYYRGAVDNNYLKFGQNTSEEDMWWRIIRVNGDGSLRIQYDGAGAAGEATYTRGFTHTKQKYNATYKDAKYVGWMFGGTQGQASTAKMYEGVTRPEDGKIYAQINETNSDLKTLVDGWYKETIVDKGLGDKVSDVMFCNDRSTPGKDSTGYPRDTGLGYGNNLTAYGAYARSGIYVSTVQPQFTCPNKNDAFTVSDTTKGNGDLTYPVGLITTDEIIAAGSGRQGKSNSSYYLAKGRYWSISPCYFDFVFVVNNLSLNMDHVYNNDGAVAPVINLKPEYVKTMVGTGTITDPYRSE